MKNLLILTYFSFFAFGLFAQDFPEKPNPPRLVNDYADVLSPEEEATLENKLVNYNDTTSTQIAIVIRKSLGDYEAADYAVQLGEKWGIGQKGKNNGVVILVSIDDRHSFIAPGYGLEGVMPDAFVARIRDQYLRSNLKNGLYYQAFDQTTTALIKLAAGEFKGEGKQQKRKGSPAGFFIVLAIIFFVFILPLFSRARRAQRNHMGGGGLDWLTALFLMNSVGRGGRNGSSWGDFSGGSGDFGGGGNDFGGFGGGDFGGGGAGGDW